MSMELSDVGEGVFAAEMLLRRRVKRGKEQYLVKWKGWCSRYNTWEPKANILDTRLLKIFKKQEEEAEARKKHRGKRVASVVTMDSASSSTNDTLNLNNDNPHVKQEPEEEHTEQVIGVPMLIGTPATAVKRTLESPPPQKLIDHKVSVSKIGDSNDPLLTNNSVSAASVVRDIKRRPGRPLGSKNKGRLKFGPKLPSAAKRYTKMKKSFAKRGINIASGSLGLRRPANPLLKRKTIIRKRGIRSVLNPANVNVPAKVKKWKANLIGGDENPDSSVSDPNWTEKEIIVTDVTSNSVTITFTECHQPIGFFKNRSR